MIKGSYNFLLLRTYFTMLLNKYSITNASTIYVNFELVRKDLRIFDRNIFLEIITYINFHFAGISISNALGDWGFIAI